VKNNQERPIADIARGHWRELLPQFGVDAKYLTGKHTPCPICGGKDRFRFTDRNGDGVFICSVCGSNDGFKLAQMVTGQSFAQVAKQVSTILGERSVFTPKDREQEEVHRQAIKRIWDTSGRPSKDGPVSQYLKRRLGLVWASKSVREFIGRNHCLMVSQIVGPDNKAHNVHLTYLDHNGFRAKIDTPKRIMSGKVPAGSAIRLAPADEVMGIAEGIETAIAASVMHGIPVWSAINAHNLAKWEPPPVTRSVIVFGDNDESFTGHAASYSLARRLKLQRKLDVTVMIPETVGQDWADVLVQASKGLDR